MVPRTPVTTCCALALALGAGLASPAHAARVLVLDGHGRVHARDDRFAGPADPPPPGTAPARPVARAAGKQHPTVRESLTKLHDAGAIDDTAYTRYTGDYDAAQATLKRLHGTPMRELRAVVANLDDLSVAHLLSASRLPVLFRTLEVNRRWWAAGRVLGYGQRVETSGSELVWQAYPGQGLQIQWLGTFGKANGLFTGREDRYDARLGALLDEARSLATQRAGGVAWEYLFHFDGGAPPWVSAIAQGTALQAYARAAVRLGRPQYFDVARQALGIFQTAPPQGVAVKTPAGARFLMYSFRPSLRILNGFVQALNGLHDFAMLANDATGRALFDAGERQLRIELPRYDTGAWSLYDTGEESDLGYHELVRDFLRGLCERLTKDREDAQAAPVVVDDSGAGGAGYGSATTTPAPTTGPDPTPYCTTAAHFTAYLRQPPAIALRASSMPRVKHRATVRFTLSKVSVVTLVVKRDGAVIFQATTRFGRGGHAFAWGPPRRPGPVSVTLRAADLAGNVATTTAATRVAR